jgi:hypothetical protein
MSAKFAPEPLCQRCGEDRADMVTSVRDGRVVTWFCAVCGNAWRQSDSPHDPKAQRDRL